MIYAAVVLLKIYALALFSEIVLEEIKFHFGEKLVPLYHGYLALGAIYMFSMSYALRDYFSIDFIPYEPFVLIIALTLIIILQAIRFSAFYKAYRKSEEERSK